jgi:predicted metal-dependent phosphoesterase TrpH
VFIDFHVHTSRSPDGIHSPRETVKFAKQAGLDAIAITDHNRLFPRREAQALSKEFELLVIPGIEGGNIAFENHWIALGIDELPQKNDIGSVLDYILEERGLSIAPHPHSRTGYADYAALGFDAVEAINGTDRLSNILLNNIHNVPEISGSDAHAGYLLGYVWTEVAGATTVDELFGEVEKGRCAARGAIIPLHRRLHYYGEVVSRGVVGEPVAFFSSMHAALSCRQEQRGGEDEQHLVMVGNETG